MSEVERDAEERASAGRSDERARTERRARRVVGRKGELVGRKL